MERKDVTPPVGRLQRQTKEGSKKSKKPSSSSEFMDLFVIKEPPPSSSSDALASLLHPPTSAYGKSYHIPPGRGYEHKEHLTTDEASTSKQAGEEDEYKNPCYQGTSQEPCQFSSSIHYGGQESYTAAPPTQTVGPYSTDLSEDEQSDSGTRGTSRGDWWRGSVYY